MRIEIDPTPVLMRERAEMRAFRRAINLALEQYPPDAAPNLPAVGPHLRATVDAAEAELPVGHPLRTARADIVLYERLHPDAEGIRQFLGVSHEWMDEFFRLAMQIENQGAIHDPA